MKKFILLLMLLPVFPCLSQKAGYPIQGVSFNKVKLTHDFWLPRIKTNYTKSVKIKLNNKLVDSKIENGYAVLKKNWKKGDIVEVSLPPQARRVMANPQVTDNLGKIALQRGPLVYWC